MKLKLKPRSTFLESVCLWCDTNADIPKANKTPRHFQMHREHLRLFEFWGWHCRIGRGRWTGRVIKLPVCTKETIIVITTQRKSKMNFSSSKCKTLSAVFPDNMGLVSCCFFVEVTPARECPGSKREYFLYTPFFDNIRS